jgi:hypothetical protein
MKKSLFFFVGLLLIVCLTNFSSTEELSKQRIAELEKKVEELTRQAPSCNAKVFNSETELRDFIYSYYNATTYKFNTVAANTDSIKATLNLLPANSRCYVSIIQSQLGREIRISTKNNMCNPNPGKYSPVCCPPNCPPKMLALNELYNPLR